MHFHLKIVSVIVASLLYKLSVAQPVAPASQYVSTAPINYVRVWEAVKPYTSVSDVINTARTAKEVRQTTQYIDGLGRPIQTVVKNGSLDNSTNPSSPVQRDMVMPVVYDAFGREQLKYLPYVSTSATDGHFKTNPFVEQVAFYEGQLSGEPSEVNVGSTGRNWAYSKTNFEASPLNRVMEAYAPGSSWVGSEAATNLTDRHPVKMTYWLNTSTDAVRIWRVEDVSNGFGTYHTTAAYGAGELYKNITEDERGKQVIEFKDKEGKVILKKVQLTASKETDGTGSGHGGWICTYYIYDDLNNLRAVIQPEGVKLLDIATWANCNPIDPDNYPNLLGEQTFRYEYDQRNRMIMKKVPGAGEVYMVYDARDRLVMTQDANMRGQQKWLFTKYDQLNRPIATGFFTNSVYTTQSSMQGYLNSQNMGFAEIFNPANYPLYSLNQTFPVVSINDVLTFTYYDDYSWTGWYGSYGVKDNSFDSYFSSTDNNWPYPQMPVQGNQTKGLVTGSWDKTGTGLVSSFIYDDKGRVIQTKSYNITAGIDITSTQYNWSGQPLVLVQRQQIAGSNAQENVVVTKMSYDDLGRLTKTEKKIGNSSLNTISSLTSSPFVVVSETAFDALGQMKTKKLGRVKDPSTGTYTSNAIETLAYDYNIRGWMLGMNRAYLNTNNSIRFGFELAYDKRKSAFDNNSADTYSASQFNGNITGMMWRSVGDGEKRKYDFEYDAVNRLGKASFAEYSGTTWSNANANFNVHGFDSDNNYQIKYDDNGNLLSMIQHAMKPGTPDFYLDALRYYYEPGSNRLKRVTDDNPNPDSKLGDFKYDPNTKTATDYTYDVNGNLVTDNNKKISSITYNHLNLPQTITVTGKGTITYTYDAAGNKLKKETNEPASSSNNSTSSVTSTLYIGGFVYESRTVNSTPVYSNKLQFGGHEEGRIRTLYTNNANPHTPTGFAYDYMLKDHLGNVRMVLTDEVQTNVYPVASLEDATVTCENYFHAVDTSKTRSRSEIYDPNTVLGYANNNGFAAGPCGDGTGTNNQMYRLFATSAGADTGLSMTLKVMSGDVINIWGKSFYNDANTSGINYSTTATQLIAGFLSGGMGGATASGHGATTSMLGSNAPTVNGLNSFITDPGRGSGTKPKAYINWILLDEQFKFVTGGFSRTDQNANTIYDHRFTDLTMSKNGYLYIYVSNESPVAVFFDNLQVMHTRGPVLEETHYYPFGLTMSGISSRALNGSPENRKKFNEGSELQNKEFSDGSGLEWYETMFRSLDPQLGRFWQIDPIAEQTSQFSPFAYANNNPVLLNDPYGLTSDSTITPTPTPPPPSNMQGKHLDEIVVVAKSTKSTSSGRDYKWYQFFNDHNPGGDFLYEVNRWNPIANIANAFWTYNTGHDSYGVQQSNTQATIQLATAFPIFRVGTVVNVLGSTGRVVARNLTEQLAMQEIMSNPSAGRILRDVLMTDKRWHHSDGWVKMSHNSAGVEIHFVAQFKNGVIQAVDDFKFK